MNEGKFEIKMATSRGLYHRSSIVKFVGNFLQSKRWAVVWTATPDSGHRLFVALPKE
jgi:hypothetical protein